MNQEQTLVFGRKVAEAMHEKGLRVIDVADRAEATYEHIRRIVRGTAFPSPYFLRVLCDVLTLDFNEMKRILAVDKVRQKFGATLPELMVTDPSLAPISDNWKNLTPKQKDKMNQRVKVLADSNVRKAS